MRRMPAAWVLTLAVACTSCGTAEPAAGPYLAVRYAHLPASDATIATGSAAIEAREHQLLAGVGLATIGRYAIRVGLDYQYTRYEFRDIDSRNRDQHRLQFPFRLQGETGAWELDAVVAPGVSTSSNVFNEPFERWSSEDAFVTAGVEGRYAVSERWRWIAGVVHDRTLGRSATYPVLGFAYEPGDALRVRLAFPDSEFVYAVSDRHTLSVRAYPAGHQWRVVSDTLDRNFDYRVRGARLDATWSYRFWRQAWIDLSLGYASHRRHRFTDDRGVRLLADPDDTWLLGLGFRFGNAPLPSAHGNRRWQQSR